MSTISDCSATSSLAVRFRATRKQTMALCETLTPEDMMVQSCPEASPAKWHLAHTAWFFESFILREFLPGYRIFNENFPWLFNSYYQSFSAIPEKRLRSVFSRPGLEEILDYREHVDQAMDVLLDRLNDGLLTGSQALEALSRIELGVNHEEQHQELLATDILHAFSTNPLKPAFRPTTTGLNSLAQPDLAGAPPCHDLLPGAESLSSFGAIPPLTFHEYPGGLCEAGQSGSSFCFDNEKPRHRVWLDPYKIANRLVTCAEFAAFMADGGYSRPELWLSAGWDAVKANGWRAPLYWNSSVENQPSSSDWAIFTLRGELPLSCLENVPVSHISYFEADAYARWAGHRLPTEYEWEVAAEPQQVAGNLLDSGRLLPAPACETPESQDAAHPAHGPSQLFGDCWEWTASAYLGYPGFKPLNGSLGEYNGKFMSGQMILRGGSCVTPAAHIRASYRNFFPPGTRWQFSGIRLAR